MDRTHNEKWLRDNALFGCRNPECAEEVSYHAEEFRVAPDGKPTCYECWEENMEKGLPRFRDLPFFNPFKIDD